MKTKTTLLTILLSCVCAMAQTYIPNLAFDSKVTDLAFKLMIGENAHPLLEQLMDEIGMPDQGSDKANIYKLCDYEGKTIEYQHNFNGWMEFDAFEQLGCDTNFFGWKVITNASWFTNGIISSCCDITNITPESITEIRRELTTNWTGVKFNGRELGYEITNHIARIIYQDATNEFTLKTVASDKAVWRDGQLIQPYIVTNTIYLNYR